MDTIASIELRTKALSHYHYLFHRLGDAGHCVHIASGPSQLITPGDQENQTKLGCLPCMACTECCVQPFRFVLYQVFRVQANFFNDSKAEAMAKEGLGDRCPWFAKEAVLKPRDSLVASPGYAFVSADYSQVTICSVTVLLGLGRAHLSLSSRFGWLGPVPGTLHPRIGFCASLIGTVEKYFHGRMYACMCASKSGTCRDYSL